MLLAVEGLGLTAARSQKTRPDAAGRVVRSRDSQVRACRMRAIPTLFSLPLVGDARQVAFKGTTRFWRWCACLRRPECCAVLCSAVRAGSACDAMRRPSRVVGPAGANMELSKTRATCFEVEKTLSGKMRLKGKRRSGDEMGRIEWKVGVGTTFLFLELRVLFNVLGGAARPLADARVAGRKVGYPVPKLREQPLGCACLGGDSLDRDAGKIRGSLERQKLGPRRRLSLHAPKRE